MNIHAVYRPFQLFFRKKRMAEFEKQFGVTDDTEIIDIGGTKFNWTLTNQNPKITIVNLDTETREEANLVFVQGDGTCLVYPDNRFDIAYSNSVIEHVGDWDKKVAFAREVARAAPYYYVQTPYRWFFVEPHLIAPFIHFFPKRTLRILVRYFSVWRWVVKADRKQIDRFVDGIDLLDLKQMRVLFPDAEIRRERFLGMTKSIIAVKYQ